MSKTINSAADILPEDRASRLNPAGSGYSSAPAAKFMLRRARYFDETGIEGERGMRRADIAQAVIPEVTGNLQQSSGSGVRDRRAHGSRR